MAAAIGKRRVSRRMSDAVPSAGASAEQTGDIIVPLARNGSINLEGLDAEKKRLLAGSWKYGISEGQRWVVADPELGSIGNGLVVVQGKFQPPTFGHELMVSFAKGFSEGASSGKGNWPLRYAIFPISTSRHSEQAIAGKFNMLLPAQARIGAWEGMGAIRGGGKRGAEEAGNTDCTGLCRRFFREDCVPEPSHIVMIVGSDAAAAEYSGEFIGDTPAALGAAREAATIFADKTNQSKLSGRPPPRHNTCLSVYPYGAERPAAISSAEALGKAHKAIASGTPVAISATLARAAAMVKDQAVLEVTRPVSEGPALLHRQYLDWYPTVNRQIAEHPKACPFCGEAFVLSKGNIVKKWCKTHYDTCPKAPQSGGNVRRTRSRKRTRNTPSTSYSRPHSRRSATIRHRSVR